MKVYSDKEIMEILSIKESTLCKYRKEGYIGYSQFGDKRWYLEDDINEFLQKNHKVAFRYEETAA